MVHFNILTQQKYMSAIHWEQEILFEATSHVSLHNMIFLSESMRSWVCSMIAMEISCIISSSRIFDLYEKEGIHEAQWDPFANLNIILSCMYILAINLYTFLSRPLVFLLTAQFRWIGLDYLTQVLKLSIHCYHDLFHFTNPFFVHIFKINILCPCLPSERWPY